jgi:hypothetical protein
MHKIATKCNKTQSKWCVNKHGASKIIDTFETYHTLEKVNKTKPKNGEEIKIPIQFKLLGIHEALEKNFDWIIPENPFDESSEPKSVEKGSSKLIWIK